MTDLPQLPRLDFVATTTYAAKPMREARGLWEQNALEDPVLASTPLDVDCWATLFAYMHRRFGPPHIGGDDHKDLSAAWLLTSPDPDLYLLVSPSLSGPWFSFTPMLAVEKEVLRIRELALAPERVEAIKDAYRAVLMDLLRPVSVRDHDINALGELGDDDLSVALMDISEEDYEADKRYEVERHASSGYPVPLGLFGGEGWSDLCHAIESLGNGDYQAGAKAVVDKVQEPVLEAARTHGWTVHRLMLLGAFNRRDQLLDGLGLDTAASDRANEDFAPFWKGDFSNLAVITDEDLNTAAGLLDELGYGSQHLKQMVNRWRFDALCSRRWRELAEASPNGFPEEILEEFPTCRDDEEAKRLQARLEQLGSAALLAWLRRVLADRDGKSVLAMILMVCNAEQRKAARQRGDDDSKA